MSEASSSPETKPCPECGGPRVVHHDIGPETVGYSPEGVASWKKTRDTGKFKLVRCTMCGYSAFFYVKKEPH